MTPSTAGSGWGVPWMLSQGGQQREVGMTPSAAGSGGGFCGCCPREGSRDGQEVPGFPTGLTGAEDGSLTHCCTPSSRNRGRRILGT